MIYVFDTSAFVSLFSNFYPSRFPTLWSMFDQMIANDRIVSTREVGREIEDQEDDLQAWMKANPSVFATPTAAEGAFVAQIYQVAHFRANIEQRKFLKGGKNADPFVIARCSTLDEGAVVTLERMKANAAKIPNICAHFGIVCMDLEQFMKAEGWSF